MIPASIRSNNPGAMWGGPSAVKFGALKAEKLNDGLNQNNEIACFTDKVHGAAALFDLMARVYAGKTIKAAITKWSGGNWVPSYLDVIEKDTGLKGSDVLSLNLLKSDKGIAFAKAMARHEAGCPYPMTDAEWKEAHDMVFKIPAADTDDEFQTPWVDQYLKWEKEGVAEVPGPGSNPTIDEMFLICGHPKDKFRDDTSWCAISGYAALALSHVDIPPPSQNTMARSFLKAFPKVPASQVRRGDFRIKPRGNDPALGHVDCVISVDHTAGTCECIGGNVGDKFTRTTYPLAGALGYVRPAVKAVDIPKVTAKEIVARSSKLTLLLRIRQFIAFLAASIASLAGVDSWGLAKGMIQDVQSLATTQSLAISLALCIAGVWLTSKWLEYRSLQDHAEGRYVPSGD